MVTEVKRADRTGGELSLLIIDLDDFGEVNKTLGHLEGDRVLADVARLLTRIFRQSDTVIRFGGDEFVVIMPDTTEAQARASRERLVAKVEEWNSARPANAYQVRLSCGVSVYEKGGKVADLFEKADRAMRMQKASREVAV
jgi:diguanylate cyclase (GGDEF)-like protein